MTQLNIATSLTEKESMNIQVGLFLGELDHFDQKDNCYLTFHYFISDRLNHFTQFSSVPQDAMSINILHLIEIIQTCLN